LIAGRSAKRSINFSKAKNMTVTKVAAN